jgi:hypothetical protein
LNKRPFLALIVSVGLAAALGAVGQSQLPRPGTALVQLSADPFTNSVAEHATEVEPDAVAVGPMIVSAFQVGRFASGGASAIGWATSTDTGKTWSSGFLPGLTKPVDPKNPYARASDPAVAFDAAHGVWLINALPCCVSGYPASVVSRSTDALHWSGPIVVAPAPRGADKTWVACDNSPTSPHYGHCYAEWDNNRLQISVNVSTDGGMTWGATQHGGIGADGVGGQPLTQPDGTVVVPFEGAGFNEKAIVSRDGGQTWSGGILISRENDHFEFFVRTSALPSSQVDGAGTVYTVWQDCSFRPRCASNDLVITSSADGKHWLPKARIPIDPTTSTVDHFNPGLGVDRSTAGANAHLAVTYYYMPQTKCNLATCQLYVGYISSHNGGATWTAPVTIAGPMSLTWLAHAGGRFVGDYLATAFTNDGLAHSVFALASAPSGTLLDEAMFTTAKGLAVPRAAVEFSSAGERPLPGVHSDHPWIRPNSPPNLKGQNAERD